MARALDFYALLGFRVALLWEAEDRSLRIAHLPLPDGSLVLELFEYSHNTGTAPIEAPTGNYLEQIGTKHLGLRVRDLVAAREYLAQRGCRDVTEIRHGRTKIDFFWVRDPDGIWVEIVQDNRNLRADKPIRLVG